MNVLLMILAQTAPTGAPASVNNGPSWEFLVAAVGIPLLLAAVAGIFWRLRNGDQKFETLMVSNAETKTEVQHLRQSNDRLVGALQSLVQQLSDQNVEAAGGVSAVRAEVAKEYVSKKEYQEDRNLIFGHYAEFLKTIREIKGAK